MKRIPVTTLAIAAIAVTTACASQTPLDVQPPPGHDGPAVTLTPDLETALRHMDCEDIVLTTPTDATETGIEMLQSGRCTPYVGNEQVEFFEFANSGDAQAWISSDGIELGSVDNAYISGPVIIVDRNNDYALQLFMQFDVAV